MGIDKTFPLAFAKAQLAAGSKLPTSGLAFVSVKDSDKKYAIDIVKKLYEIGFDVVTTRGTAKFLADNDIATTIVNKITEEGPNIVDMIEQDKISLVINTTQGTQTIKDSFSIRRTAFMKQITHATTISGAKALVDGILEYQKSDCKFEVNALQDF